MKRNEKSMKDGSGIWTDGSVERTAFFEEEGVGGEEADVGALKGRREDTLATAAGSGRLGINARRWAGTAGNGGSALLGH
jgi:hypothetical protein